MSVSPPLRWTYAAQTLLLMVLFTVYGHLPPWISRRRRTVSVILLCDNIYDMFISISHPFHLLQWLVLNAKIGIVARSDTYFLKLVSMASSQPKKKPWPGREERSRRRRKLLGRRINRGRRIKTEAKRKGRRGGSQSCSQGRRALIKTVLYVMERARKYSFASMKMEVLLRQCAWKGSSSRGGVMWGEYTRGIFRDLGGRSHVG